MVVVIGSVKTVIGMKMRLPEIKDGEPRSFGEEMLEASYREAMQDVDRVEDDGIEISGSGCGYIVAKYLAEEGNDVAFISAVGTDIIGNSILHELRECGIDTKGIAQREGITPISVRQYNILGDVETDRSNDELAMSITPEMVDENCSAFEQAELIFMDGSIPRETIEYVAEKYGVQQGKRIVFDPAGERGAFRSRGVSGGFYCVLPGRTEAEIMTRLTILSEEQLSEAGRFMEDKGVSFTVITLKGGGVYCRSGEYEETLRPERVIEFARTSGAGDVLAAAATSGIVAGMNPPAIARRAMAAAAAYLQNTEDKAYLE